MHHIAKLRRELRLEHYERRRLLEPSLGAPTRRARLERLLHLLGVRQRRPHGRAVGIIADLLEPGVGAPRVLFCKELLQLSERRAAHARGLFVLRLDVLMDGAEVLNRALLF